MGTNSLNLSRKWRSRNFDQLVGQNLVVRILKNSLYSMRYFPVYLFVGQRGCGKTSTARIFAAALNCVQLPEFQKNPKAVSIPCLECESCRSMVDGSHPDFIEIDAASHTGVDNMRNIIEASALLPVMGSKRIYLIDEAHMLSKAACNAALKILEEPPASAIFILATTNPHKIIDTVRSRCFTLFFSRIEHNALKNHLEQLCIAENIRYDTQGLEAIVRQSEGSARDAINLLERVRFSHSIVDGQAVSALLGHMQDRELVTIISALCEGDSHNLLSLLTQIGIENYSAEFIWQRLMVLLRACLWAKHGLDMSMLVSCPEEVKKCVASLPLSALVSIAETLYSQEELFNKTTMQHVVLEMILLSCIQQQDDKKKTDNVSIKRQNVISASPEAVEKRVSALPQEILASEHKDERSSSGHECWALFIEKIIAANHPVLTGLFKKAALAEYDQKEKKIFIEFPKDMALFEEWLVSEKKTWQPLLHESFGLLLTLVPRFLMPSQPQEVRVQTSETSAVRQPVERAYKPAVPNKGVVQTYNNGYSNSNTYPKKKVFPRAVTRNEVAIDISNKSEWKIASMLMDYFPGIITEVREPL